MAKSPAENGEKRRESEVVGSPEPDARLTTKAATGTVVVGCKIPNGIILQLSTFEKSTEPVMGGGHRNVELGRKVGDKYVVKGPAIPFGTIPKYLMVGGYALTSGIPEEFWNEWLKQNQDSEIVQRRLVIAHKAMESLEDECRDNERVLTGLEPIDPQRLPRGIQTAPEQSARR